MAIFTVHHARDGLEEAVLIREGFAWGALVFGALWFFYHRLWLEGVVVILASVVLIMGLATWTDLPGGAHDAVLVGLNILIAAEARDWHRYVLDRKGLVQQAVVSAGSLDEAELRYFHGVDTRPVPAKADPVPTTARPDMAFFEDGFSR